MTSDNRASSADHPTFLQVGCIEANHTPAHLFALSIYEGNPRAHLGTQAMASQGYPYPLALPCPKLLGIFFPLASTGTTTGCARLLGSGSELTAVHMSMTPARRAGSMLYCRLYRFLRFSGGTNLPVRRHSSTRGER